MKSFLDARQIKLPNLEELNVKEKQSFINKVSERIELSAKHNAKNSFECSLKEWELLYME